MSDRKPESSVVWEDLGICKCGVATWVRVPDDGTIAYHPGKWYCQRCKRLHPLEEVS